MDFDASDLLEILEDRLDNRSTIVPSQLPLDQWHHIIGDPTLVAAILDRLVHNAYKINLKGESMRKKIKVDNTDPFGITIQTPRRYRSDGWQPSPEYAVKADVGYILF